MKPASVAGSWSAWIAAAAGLLSAAVPAAGHAALPVAVVPVAQPPLPRPIGRACVVTLVDRLASHPSGNPMQTATTPDRFDYRPPANCPGPWAKVVLEADFDVAAGRQFDRTATLWLAGVNLYYGTTQEPSASHGAHWHVERDLSAYASLFSRPGTGRVALNNWVDRTYTSSIGLSARLVFYPANPMESAPKPADAVLPLGGEQAGAPVSLARSDDTLAHEYVLPRNVAAAYLDVIAQSQGNDEPWYTCVPDADIAATARFALEVPYAGAPLQQCGKSSFRLVELRIDHQPAGLAPVFPWTYTGGIDPHLWRPTPSVQTLNLLPYRLDLTPFAALLSDGRPHEFAVRVLGANQYFKVAANLLVYRDPSMDVVHGALSRNSLAGSIIQPRIQRRLRYRGARTDGWLSVTQHSRYVIDGYVDTPAGRRRSRVEQSLDFANRQRFSTPAAGHYRQTIVQESSSHGASSQWLGPRLLQRRRWRWQAPLLLRVDKRQRDDGSFDAALRMSQSFKQWRAATPDDAFIAASLEDSVVASDTVHLNAMGDHVIDHHDQRSEEHYAYRDPHGGCYRRTLRNADEAPLAMHKDPRCDAAPDWRAHPDGAP